jgi:5-methyltetrahydropteroyltriglutamate--homocysteine methyltransferase
VKDWGVAALERAAHGVTVTKAVHICYGYGTADVKRWKSANTDWSHYEATLPLLANSSIDQVSVETAASGVDVSVISALRGKDVLLGVVDVGSETVESAETVADRLRAALNHIDPRPSVCLHRLRNDAFVAAVGGRETPGVGGRCGPG